MANSLFDRRSALLALAFSIAACGLSAADEATNYPDKPIHVIVPFAPGGATDIVGRMLAERVSRQVGQPVLVENRAGANGNIGADLVAHSAPDGYTLLHNTSSIMFTAAFGAKVNYDLATELAPVSLLVTQPLIEEASADLEDEDAETEDESDEEAPARRASGVGKHPTKRSSR